MERKKIAIIGGGVSGLTAIKTCLDEDLEPVCLERSNKMGGLWHFEEKLSNSQSTVMKSTTMITSKEVMAFSDFLIPDDYPNFMHNSKVMEYFYMYAEKFNLLKHMKFQQEIIACNQAADFSTTGRWTLKIKDIPSGKEHVDEYDAVLICTGHHSDKKLPEFPGQDVFKGQQLHSHDYRTLNGYEDKRVVVVGVGNSACDLAVELSRVCKQIYISTRRGAWVMNRVGDNGIPEDLNNTRFRLVFRSLVPESWMNSFLERKVERRFNHSLFSMRPEHRWNAAYPSVSDELPNRIISGTILIKPNIQKLTKTGVEFEDGTSVDDIDAIIYATGYQFDLPFLQKGIIEVHNNETNLFKYCFPPDLKPSTIAAIGFMQPFGALMPIAELQCRWATRIFNGKASLPTSQLMWKDICEKKQAMAKQFVKSMRHTMQVDWIPFMDEVAEQVGCKPNIWKLMLRDPKLGWKCLMDPCTPYQYRLMGPLPWKGAREAIMRQWDRVKIPLQTRAVHAPLPQRTMLKYIALIVPAAVIFQWGF